MANTSIIMKGPTLPDTGASQAWAAGIPLPTAAVPSAIMPDVPTGADFDDHEWIGTYNPETYDPGQPGAWPSAEATNYYYIDKFHGSATDTANSYGYPNKPRLTIPTSFWGSSTIYAEIIGNSTAWGSNSNDYSIASLTTCTHTGTSSVPVVVKGTNNPWISYPGGGNNQFTLTCTHTLWRGIRFKEDGTGNRVFPVFAVTSSNYFYYKDGKIQGQNTLSTGGGQMCPLSGTEADPQTFIVFDNVPVEGGGSHLINTNEVDVHGWRPLYWNRYLWYMNGDISKIQGDCIQIGNSSNADTNKAQRSHYIYIGNNNLHDGYENGLDCKNSYHVISSKNRYYNWGLSDSPSVVSLLISNNDEGAHTGFHWSLFDKVYDSTQGIRCSGDQTDDYSGVIGCVLYNLTSYVFRKENQGVGPEFYMVNCTAYDCGDIFTRNQDNATISIRNCIFHTCGNADMTNGVVSEFTDNFHYNCGTISSAWDTTAGSTTSDPGMVSPSTQDFTLGTSAAAKAYTTADPIYQTFQDMYGLDITQDIDGNNYPATSTNCGAYQEV